MPSRNACYCLSLHPSYVFRLFTVLIGYSIALCYMWSFFHICVTSMTYPGVRPLWDEYSPYINTATFFWLIQMGTMIFTSNEMFFIFMVCPTAAMFLIHSIVYISVTTQTVTLWIQDQKQEHFDSLDKVWYVPAMMVLSLLVVFTTFLFCRSIVAFVKWKKETICYFCETGIGFYS